MGLVVSELNSKKRRAARGHRKLCGVTGRHRGSLGVRVGRKQWSSVDMTVNGIEPGVSSVKWIGVDTSWQ